MNEKLIEDAVKIAAKIVKPLEGCSLVSYPDPASPLYKELSKHNILQKFLQGKLDLPDYLRDLSGTPWTIGMGETKGVKQGDKITQEQADSMLLERLKEFAQGVLKASPKLSKHSPEKLAAVTSFAYNVGLGAYKGSTVARCIGVEDMEGAARAFSLWNKAGGLVMNGLVKRRQVEADLFRSVRG